MSAQLKFSLSRSPLTEKETRYLQEIKERKPLEEREKEINRPSKTLAEAELRYAQVQTREVETNFMIACGESEEFQCLIPRLGKKRVQERAAAHDPVALYTWGPETRQTKPQECLRLITESAELSFVFAQRWLGFSYSSGTDAPKDCQKARYWLDRRVNKEMS